MHNKIGLLTGAVFSLCLCSCSPSPVEEAAAFLNKHEAGMYYCGENTSIYERVDDYHNFPEEDVPEELPEFCEFVFDVEYSMGRVTADDLDEVYSAFSKGTYLYVVFMNYNDDLYLFLQGSRFAKTMPGYEHGNPYTRYLTYLNDGTTKWVRNTPANLQFTNAQQTNFENYRVVILDDYYRRVQSVLMEY